MIDKARRALILINARDAHLAHEVTRANEAPSQAPEISIESLKMRFADSASTKPVPLDKFLQWHPVQRKSPSGRSKSPTTREKWALQPRSTIRPAFALQRPSRHGVAQAG